MTTDHSAWRRAGWAALGSGALGAAAWWRGALDNSGALGALVTGTSIAGAGGWDWGAALVYFFVSSSALSRVASARKRAVAADKFAKGSQRDLGQALANAGVASALALARATPWGARTRPARWLRGAAAGALATANADTWATEIGTLSARTPRLITSGRQVAAGTSGGVTPLGLAAALAGAGTLGAVFALASRSVAVVNDGRTDSGMNSPSPTVYGPGRTPAIHGRERQAAIHDRAGAERDARAVVGAALAGGIAGSLMDSLLGATAQAMFWCPRCQTETERRVHRCGASTAFRRGWRWMDNDVVNAASTLAGALVGGVVTVILTESELRGAVLRTSRSKTKRIAETARAEGEQRQSAWRSN
jgi:uncharacterized protein (TIGR00297 family)